MVNVKNMSQGAGNAFFFGAGSHLFLIELDFNPLYKLSCGARRFVFLILGHLMRRGRLGKYVQKGVMVFVGF